MESASLRRGTEIKQDLNKKKKGSRHSRHGGQGEGQGEKIGWVKATSIYRLAESKISC